MRIKVSDVVVCGFALFAIFFGAGNLIFPPYIGLLAGDRWLEATFAFLLSDPVLPILGVIVTASFGGRAEAIGQRVGPNFAKILGAIAIILIGPLFSVPRTGATTHEIFVQSFFPTAPQWITSVIFFAITLYATLNPAKVMDRIGKYLTPTLLILLAFIVGIAWIHPPGEIITTPTEDLFALSFKEGYQTMDALGAALMTGILVSDLKRRGYHDKSSLLKATMWIGGLAFILLAIVYGGLTFAGASVSQFFTPEINRTHLFIEMTDLLLGSFGKLIMGIVVSLACLTTAIGLTSTTGNYFSSITNEKFSYRKIVIVTVIFEFLISLLGVDALISIAVPILSAIYPIIIVLIILGAFDRFIKYNGTYTGAVLGAGIIGCIQASHLIAKSLGSLSLNTLNAWTQALPFNQFGFEWVVPAIIGSIIFTMISLFKDKNMNKLTYTEDI